MVNHPKGYDKRVLTRPRRGKRAACFQVTLPRISGRVIHLDAKTAFGFCSRPR